MTIQTYDLVIIGAGVAGSTAASTAAEDGHRVALIEQDRLGGTCHNYGCDPTKTMLHVAQLRYQARHADTYGLDVSVHTTEWQDVQAWVQRVLDDIEGGSYEVARQNIVDQGIELLTGAARFVSPNEISVDDETISAKNILIATGTTSVVPDVPGLREAGFITNVEAVALETLPKRLAVVGGGAIGSEFAQLFHRFGVEVTLIEQGDTLMSKEDGELSDMLAELLRAEGITIELGAELSAVAVDGAGKQLSFKQQGQTHTVTVDEILLALGRAPNFDGLNIEAAGVETTKHGVTVDETLRTNVPHIWAAGDIATSFPFTHTADEQGALVAKNIFAATPKPFNTTAIPWATYTDPELGHVGKTEEELKEDGVTFTVGRAKLEENDRAKTDNQKQGMVKVLVGSDGAILGGHVLAAHGGELIAPLVLAMRHGLKAQALAETVLPYPTLSESVRQACQDALSDDS